MPQSSETPKSTPPAVDPIKLVRKVAKATGLRGAKVEARQNGKKFVITAPVGGKPTVLAYVNPLKRGDGFTVEVADYGKYRTVRADTVQAAAEAVASSERTQPKPKAQA